MFVLFEYRTSHDNLDPLEMRVLRYIKPEAQTEKKIAKKLKVDKNIISVVITDLILKGYLETSRRRRMYFFSNEFCAITVDGISVIERARSPMQNLFEMIRIKLAETWELVLAESPALRIAALSARTLYKVARTVA